MVPTPGCTSESPGQLVRIQILGPPLSEPDSKLAFGSLWLQVFAQESGLTPATHTLGWVALDKIRTQVCPTQFLTASVWCQCPPLPRMAHRACLLHGGADHALQDSVIGSGKLKLSKC